MTKMYLVLSKSGAEGVAFTDKRDAEFAATGKHPLTGDPLIGDQFREADRKSVV